MRVDVVVGPVAVLPLADEIGQFTHFVQRRSGLLQKQAVVQLQAAAGVYLVAYLIDAGHAGGSGLEGRARGRSGYCFLALPISPSPSYRRVYAGLNRSSTCYNPANSSDTNIRSPGMTERAFDRRDFHKLTAAALGGLATGAVLGCGGSNPPAPAPAATPGTAAPGPVAAVTPEKHLCRGLNECKGQGKGGQNTCRGQGACATVAESTCAGQNECKGLGGCGENVGLNECKGKGLCHIPLMDEAWKKVRERKEAECKEKKLDSGAAPAKAA